MPIYQDYPDIGLNYTNLFNLNRNIRPQFSIDFSSFSNGSTPTETNGTKYLDPAIIDDISSYLGGTTATVTNGRFGSTPPSAVIFNCPIVETGFYFSTNIKIPATAWNVDIFLLDVTAVDGGYGVEIDSTTSTLTIYASDALRTNIEVIASKKVNVSASAENQVLLFQWDGNKRFQASWRGELILGQDDTYDFVNNFPALIVTNNVINSFEGGAAEYFSNLSPNGPDRGISYGNIALSNPDVFWPGTVSGIPDAEEDNGQSLIQAINNVSSQNLAPFLTLDYAPIAYSDTSFPGDIEDKIRVGAATSGIWPEDITKFETYKNAGINFHVYVDDFGDIDFAEVTSLAEDDCSNNRVPFFVFEHKDTSGSGYASTPSEIGDDFDTIINSLINIDCPVWIVVNPSPEGNVETSEDYTAQDWLNSQSYFKNRLRYLDARNIAFSKLHFDTFYNINNSLIENYWEDGTWDFLTVFSFINEEIETATPNSLGIIENHIQYTTEYALVKEKKIVWALAVNDLDDGGATPYVDPTLQSCVPPTVFPSPPNGALQYIDYSTSISDINKIEAKFTFKSDIVSQQETFLQMYESDLDISHQYFGVQTDGTFGGGSFSSQMLIFSKFLSGEDRQAQESEVLLSSYATYTTGNEGDNFISLRKVVSLEEDVEYTIIVQRAYVETLFIDGVNKVGDWFEFYFGVEGLEEIVGSLWFERDDPLVEASFASSGGTWTEFWKNNNESTLYPVPEQRFFVKPLKFNDDYGYTTVFSHYSDMPNSDTSYVLATTPYDGYFDLKLGGSTERCHIDDATIDVTYVEIFTGDASDLFTEIFGYITTEAATPARADFLGIAYADILSTIDSSSDAFSTWLGITNSAYSALADEGVQLRSGILGLPNPELVSFYADAVAEIMSTYTMTNVVVWKNDRDIVDQTEYTDLYKEIESKLDNYTRIYGPNIRLAARGEGYDTSYNGVLIDSRDVEALQDFIDGVEAATPLYRCDGIAFYGNFDTEDWPLVVEYVKSITDLTVLVSDIEYDDATPDTIAETREKINGILEETDQTDIVFIPCGNDDFFSIPNPEFAGFQWRFEGSLTIPEPGALNAKLNFKAYSENILGNSYTSVEGVSYSLSKETPSSGSSLSLGNMIDGTYDVVIYGDILSTGNASLRVSFSADNFDESTVFDTIYLTYPSYEGEDD